MFYVKNVPNWERMLCLITGLVGIYPMCAMVGRALDRRN